MKHVFPYLKQTIIAWSNDNISVWSASLAYYTIFSLSPLLLVIIGITGFLFGKQAIETNIFYQAKDLFGDTGASMLLTIAHNASKPSQGIVATVVGVGMLLVGASGVFGQLQAAFNHIWKVETRPGAGLWRTFRQRILSFSMVIVLAFLLLVSLLLTTAITSIGNYLNMLLPIPAGLLESLNFLTSFAIVTILFMLLFKQLPDVKLVWKDVFAGGVVTALLFVIGKTILGIYLGSAGFASVYGPAASLVVLLVWVYYTAQIVFFGVEFTKIYVQNQEKEIIPAEYAIVREGRKDRQDNQPENVIDAAVKGYLKERERQRKSTKTEKKSRSKH